MIAIAQFVAISCYIGAAALAAVPFARPVRAPLGGVIAVLQERGMRAPERRTVIDKVAAAVMLQSWLDARRSLR